MTSTFLKITIFATEDTMSRSDQVLVPRGVWEAFDQNRTQNGPLFVGVGLSEESDKGFGRLRAALPEDNLPDSTCRVPLWMFIFIGADSAFSDDLWVLLSEPETIPVAHTIVLRARTEATLTESLDPVVMLTAALSGAEGGQVGRFSM